MGGFSTMHWIVVGLVVLILFGRGKIAETMGDFGKGIRSFKRGIAEEEMPAKQLRSANGDATKAHTGQNSTDSGEPL